MNDKQATEFLMLTFLSATVGRGQTVQIFPTPDGIGILWDENRRVVAPTLGAAFANALRRIDRTDDGASNG